MRLFVWLFGFLPTTLMAGINCQVDLANLYPSVVRVANKKKAEHCSGTIYGSGLHVLLAGHCLYLWEGHFAEPTDASDVLVYQGPLGDKGPTQVQNIFIHPLYRGPLGNTDEYDIAVLELSTPLAPIAELNFNIPEKGSVQLAGYGTTILNSHLADGKRRYGKNSIAQIGKHFVDFKEVMLPPIGEKIPDSIPSIPAGQDSGSPLFQNGKVVAVHTQSLQRWFLNHSTLVKPRYVGLFQQDTKLFISQFLEKE